MGKPHELTDEEKDYGDEEEHRKAVRKFIMQNSGKKKTGKSCEEHLCDCLEAMQKFVKRSMNQLCPRFFKQRTEGKPVKAESKLAEDLDNTEPKQELAIDVATFFEEGEISESPDLKASSQDGLAALSKMLDAGKGPEAKVHQTLLPLSSKSN